MVDANSSRTLQDDDEKHKPRKFSTIEAIKWGLPAAFNAFGFATMSVTLHIGTYYYIRVMDRFELVFNEHESQIGNSTLSAYKTGTEFGEVSFGSLQDPLEGTLGWTKYSLSELDAASLVLPTLWFFLALYYRDLQLWTKTLLCHGMLSIIKGFFSFLTVIPDSIGWKQCRLRLGDANLASIRGLPDPETDGAFSLIFAIMGMETESLVVQHKMVRFCADMLYSGHTFVTCLYGLALVELYRKCSYERKDSDLTRLAVVLGLSAFVILEQSIEMYMVLSNRFHYTIDVVLAFMMVLLWNTNAAVAVASQRWNMWKYESNALKPRKKSDQNGESNFHRKVMDLPGFNESWRDDYAFVCQAEGVPLALRELAQEQGFAIVETFKNIISKNTDEEEIELPEGFQEWAEKLRMKIMPMEAANRTDGDIWIPCICMPFCCLMGRHHIVSESHDDYNQCEMGEGVLKKTYVRLRDKAS